MKHHRMLFSLVVQVLGVPTPQTWPGYADLPHRIDFKPAPGQPLASVFKQVCWLHQSVSKVVLSCNHPSQSLHKLCLCNNVHLLTKHTDTNSGTTGSYRPGSFQPPHVLHLPCGLARAVPHYKRITTVLENQLFVCPYSNACVLLLRQPVQAPPEALNLLQHLMAFDPEQRITAAEALAHPYFTSQPAPTAPAQLPRPATTRYGSAAFWRLC